VAGSPAPLAEAGPLRIGATFLDKYQICERIGHGGQAWVYRGKHIFTAREVAIKIVHSPHGMTQETLLRAKAEARALGKLDHPNIVVMHDAGVTDEGLFYIVMELLRGRSLRAALAAHGRLRVEEALRLAIQAGEALQVAHEVGLIHRDLKPDNIYLTRDNRLKVLDFGIAKVLNEIGFTTRKDIVIGSVLYMSPEQVQGLPLSPRSDICALGLTMFEALSGKHPSLLVFERDLSEQGEPSRLAALADIPPIQVNRMPPSLSELDPNIPSYVAQVVQRAMAKVATARFPAMRDFVSALRDCLQTFVKETPITLRGASARDLSRDVPRAREQPPASQRATPRCGLVWDGVGAPTPAATVSRAAPPAELDDVTEAIRALPEGADSNLYTPSPVVSVAAARAGATASLRNAIIGGCLFGAALGSVGALSYFGAAGRVASASSFQNSVVVASLSPATPVATSEGARALEPPPEHAPSAVARAAPVVSAPAPHEPALHSSAPIARATRPPTRATVSAKSVNGESRSKLSNGGKLIYGD
jgi:serine/threonine-protein kinase